MGDSLNSFDGFGHNYGVNGLGNYGNFLEEEALNKTKSSSTDTKTDSNTNSDHNLYSGTEEQFTANVIESVNSGAGAQKANQGNSSVTSYSNNSLSKLNNEQNGNDTLDSFNSMQNVSQSGCGCSACGGGAPVNVLSNSGSVTTSSDVVADSGSGGGGAGAGKPFGSAEDFADYLITGFWQDFGGDSRSWAQDSLTFSISNSYSAAQKEGIRMAFEQWEDVADLTFTEVGSGGDLDIRVGPVGDGAYSSSNTSGNTIISNYISIDTSKSYWQDFNEIGDYAMTTMIHEIGHSLGLGHTGNYNGTANYNDDATWANDTRQYTVMSYFDADNYGADHADSSGWQYASTPLLYDIYAIQEIYGANNTIRSGHTTYGFNSNAGRDQYNFAISDDPVAAIWDTGGTDTLDLSGFSNTQTVRLGEGEFSDVGGLTGNLAIAYGTTIENVTGGSGVDNIYGNDSDNVILGGNGNDVLFGSAGDDTLNGQGGSGDTANYNFSTTAFAFDFINSVTVAFEHIADAWTDTLSNIENFIFTDGSYTFAELETAFDNEVNDFVPTVTANDLTLDVNASIEASNIITAADADGNSLTYEVWDSSKPDDTGYFDLNGERLKANQGYTLTQAEFDSLLIIGGSVDIDDTLWVRVSDGAHTSDWEKFILATDGGSGQGFINTPPQVTTNNLTLGDGESVLACSTVTVNDVDGQTLAYEIWDSGTENDTGYFELDGNSLSSKQSHSLTQAEFDALQIVGGSTSGDEKLWVRVTDGVDMTAWSSFTLSTDIAGGGGGGANNAPNLTTNNLTLDGGAFVLASSVITANDTDGDTLTYEVWDSGVGNNSGYFDLNGSKLDAGINHTLTQAEFDALKVVGGTYNGQDKLWIRISDDTETTAWKQFLLTTDLSSGNGGANNAPVAAANDFSLEEGESALASTAFSANDADGDTLTYEVWDSGKKASSGYFELNSVKLSAGTAHELTQAEFDALLIVGGSQSGTDLLWVRATDDWEFSAWEDMTLTTTEPVNSPAPQIGFDDVLESGDDEIGVALDEMADGEAMQAPAPDSDIGSGLDIFGGVNGFDEESGGALI